MNFISVLQNTEEQNELKNNLKSSYGVKSLNIRWKHMRIMKKL